MSGWINPFVMTSDAYAEACTRAGVKGGAPGAIARYRELFRTGQVQSGDMSIAHPVPTKVHESASDEGTVRKFLLPLSPSDADQKRAAPGVVLETESVLIPMIGKKRVLTHTLCVSSQVGCAMGCVFCQTAQMGLIRSLTPSEILMQWFVARHVIAGYQTDRPGCNSIRNVVFMGMGEPMDNLENVIAAIAVLSDRNGPGLPMSKITLSTVGRVDGIARLGQQIRTPGWHRLNLAISLNAPNDQVRSIIMPINKAMPLAQLREAIEAWPIYGAAKICFEYVLIPGVNDARDHARELGDFVLGRGAYSGRGALPGLVNLIPYNPRENSPWPAPDETLVDAFMLWLSEEGVYAKRRRTKGRDTMAACGQLGNVSLRRTREPAAALSERGVRLTLSAAGGGQGATHATTLE
jgi:23S rRNA (adenine2503-C2)-methyltransferase